MFVVVVVVVDDDVLCIGVSLSENFNGLC